MDEAASPFRAVILLSHTPPPPIMPALSEDSPQKAPPPPRSSSSSSSTSSRLLSVRPMSELVETPLDLDLGEGNLIRAPSPPPGPAPPLEEDMLHTSRASVVIEVRDVPKEFTSGTIRALLLSKYGKDPEVFTQMVIGARSDDKISLVFKRLTHAIQAMELSNGNLISSSSGGGQPSNCSYKKLPILLPQETMTKCVAKLGSNRVILLPCVVSMSITNNMATEMASSFFRSIVTHKIPPEGTPLFKTHVNHFLGRLFNDLKQNLKSCSDKGQFDSGLLLFEGQEQKAKFFQLLSGSPHQKSLLRYFSHSGILPGADNPDLLYARSIPGAFSAPSKIQPDQCLHKCALFQDSFESMLNIMSSLDGFLEKNCSPVDESDTKLKEFDVWCIDVKCNYGEATAKDLFIMQIGIHHRKGDGKSSKEHLFMGTHEASPAEQEQSILASFTSALVRNPRPVVLGSFHNLLAVPILMSSLSKHNLTKEFCENISGYFDLKMLVKHLELYHLIDPFSGQVNLRYLEDFLGKEPKFYSALRRKSALEIATELADIVEHFGSNPKIGRMELSKVYQNWRDAEIHENMFESLILKEDVRLVSKQKQVLTCHLSEPLVASSSPSTCMIVPDKRLFNLNLEAVTKNKGTVTLEYFNNTLGDVMYDQGTEMAVILVENPKLISVSSPVFMSMVSSDRVLSCLSFFEVNCQKLSANSTHNSLCSMFLRSDETDRKVKDITKNFQGSPKVSNYDILVAVVKVAEPMVAQVCIRRLRDDSKGLFQTYKYKKDGSNIYTHQDNGSAITIKSLKKCASDIRHILQSGDPKIILCHRPNLVIPYLESELRVERIGDQENVAGLVDLEWCLPPAKRRRYRMSWAETVSIMLNRTLSIEPKEADSVARVTCEALKNLPHLTFPLALSNFIEVFAMDMELFHNQQRNRDMFLLFQKHLEGVIDSPEMLLISPKKKTAIALKTANYSGEMALSISSSPKLEVEDPEQPQEADLIMVDMKLSRLGELNVLHSIEMYLPSQPYLHYVHTKPVPITHTWSPEFQRKYVTRNGEGKLCLKFSNVTEEASTEAELAMDLLKFLEPVCSNSSMPLVLVLPNVPNFGPLNEIFKRQRVWSKLRRHVSGWTDISSHVYNFISGKYKCIKSVETSATKITDIYYHFFHTRPEFPGVRCLSDIWFKIHPEMKTIPLKQVEPFFLKRSDNVFVCVHTDTINSSTQYFADKTITMLGYYIKSSGASSGQIPIIPYGKYSLLELKQKGISRDANDKWVYRKNMTDSPTPCQSLANATRQLLRILSVEVKADKCKGVVYISLSKEIGLCDLMRGVIAAGLEKSFYQMTRGAMDVATYLKQHKKPSGDGVFLKDFYLTRIRKHERMVKSVDSCQDSATMTWDLLMKMAHSVRDEVVSSKAFTTNNPYLHNVLFQSGIPEFREDIVTLKLCEDIVVPDASTRLRVKVDLTDLIWSSDFLHCTIVQYPTGNIRVEAEECTLTCPTVQITILGGNHKILSKGTTVGLAICRKALDSLNRTTRFAGRRPSSSPSGSKALSIAAAYSPQLSTCSTTPPLTPSSSFFSEDGPGTPTKPMKQLHFASCSISDHDRYHPPPPPPPPPVPLPVPRMKTELQPRLEEVKVDEEEYIAAAESKEIEEMMGLFEQHEREQKEKGEAENMKKADESAAAAVDPVLSSDSDEYQPTVREEESKISVITLMSSSDDSGAEKKNGSSWLLRQRKHLGKGKKSKPDGVVILEDEDEAIVASSRADITVPAAEAEAPQSSDENILSEAVAARIASMASKLVSGNSSLPFRDLISSFYLMQAAGDGNKNKSDVDPLDEIKGLIDTVLSVGFSSEDLHDCLKLEPLTEVTLESWFSDKYPAVPIILEDDSTSLLYRLIIFHARGNPSTTTTTITDSSSNQKISPKNLISNNTRQPVREEVSLTSREMTLEKNVSSNTPAAVVKPTMTVQPLLKGDSRYDEASSGQSTEKLPSPSNSSCSHESLKPILCLSYLNGNCNKGSGCPFSHTIPSYMDPLYCSSFQKEGKCNHDKSPSGCGKKHWTSKDLVHQYTLRLESSKKSCSACKSRLASASSSSSSSVAPRKVKRVFLDFERACTHYKIPGDICTAFFKFDSCRAGSDCRLAHALPSWMPDDWCRRYLSNHDGDQCVEGCQHRHLTPYELSKTYKNKLRLKRKNCLRCQSAWEKRVARARPGDRVTLCTHVATKLKPGLCKGYFAERDCAYESSCWNSHTLPERLAQSFCSDLDCCNDDACRLKHVNFQLLQEEYLSEYEKSARACMSCSSVVVPGGSGKKERSKACETPPRKRGAPSPASTIVTLSSSEAEADDVRLSSDSDHEDDASPSEKRRKKNISKDQEICSTKKKYPFLCQTEITGRVCEDRHCHDNHQVPGELLGIRYCPEYLTGSCRYIDDCWEEHKSFESLNEEYGNKLAEHECRYCEDQPRLSSTGRGRETQKRRTSSSHLDGDDDITSLRERRRSASPRDMIAANVYCRKYNSASGCNNSTCGKKHIYVRCEFFMRGQCRYGQTCYFSHELKSKSKRNLEEEEESPASGKRRNRSGSDAYRPRSPMERVREEDAARRSSGSRRRSSSALWQPPQEERDSSDCNDITEGSSFNVFLTKSVQLYRSSAGPGAKGTVVSCKIHARHDLRGWIVDLEQAGSSSQAQWYVRHAKGIPVGDANMVEVEIVNGSKEFHSLDNGLCVAKARKARRS